jgi:hypothetical protein
MRKASSGRKNTKSDLGVVAMARDDKRGISASRSKQFRPWFKHDDTKDILKEAAS